MSAMDIIETPVNISPVLHSAVPSMNLTPRTDTVQYWKDKCIDLLEKREHLQAHMDDSCHDYCSLKEKYRDCCRELNVAEGEVKQLKTEINDLNEKINTLSNRLESRCRSASPKRRRTESSSFNNAASLIVQPTVTTPRVVKGVPKQFSATNDSDLRKDFKSFLSERPLPKSVAEFKHELTNSKTNSFTGKCATYLLSALLTEAVHTPSSRQTPAMKSIIKMGWTTPAGFTLQFKKSKPAKSRESTAPIEILPAIRYDPATIRESYLPLSIETPSGSTLSGTPVVPAPSSLLSHNEIVQQINNSPCPKYLTLHMNDKQTGEYLLYRADSKHQYPGVDITVNGDVYSIDLRQVRGAKTLIHIIPSRTENNGRFRHKLTAEFAQLVAVPGKYAQLLRDLQLTPIDPNVPVCLKEYPTPPDGVAITKLTLTKHLHSCNITALFMNDIFPYGRRFTELQVGKAQPIEESGVVNQVREDEWNETLTKSNNAITFGRPAGRPGNNILVNTVPCVPVALQPTHKKKSKSSVIHAIPKTPNPQVEHAAEQLGVISFNGLPEFVDEANEPIGPVLPVDPSISNPETAVAIVDVDTDMIPIEDIIDAGAFYGSENEDDFADAADEVIDRETPGDVDMKIDSA
ncbi:hypothetical protein C8J56DRAFT_1094485 [Mycena floridula]|nr:hypothetical protein C8J56DRAFT_1094485 [Mycena floridula]